VSRQVGQVPGLLSSGTKNQAGSMCMAWPCMGLVGWVLLLLLIPFLRTLLASLPPRHAFPSIETTRSSIIHSQFVFMIRSLMTDDIP
jgi:hypothetical protein